MDDVGPLASRLVIFSEQERCLPHTKSVPTDEKKWFKSDVSGVETLDFA
jgi:hypothetical protein